MYSRYIFIAIVYCDAHVDVYNVMLSFDSWVKEFLNDANRGLRQLVHYMNFRYQIEMKYVK